jgi:hypothetical protein
VKFCFELDEKNKQVAHATSKEWFNKDMTRAVLDEFYFSNMMKPKEEQKYSPTLSTRIQHNGTTFKTQFFNQNREPIEFDSIQAGSSVIPLIETRGIWLAGKSFGMSLKLVQLMVFSRDEFVGCCIDSGLPEVRAPPRSIAEGMVLAEDLEAYNDEEEPEHRRRKVAVRAR